MRARRSKKSLEEAIEFERRSTSFNQSTPLRSSLTRLLPRLRDNKNEHTGFPIHKKNQSDSYFLGNKKNLKPLKWWLKNISIHPLFDKC